MAAPAKKVIPLPVRELVEFTRRSGDLGGSGDFVGSDRALAGTRGHQRLQKSRPEGYRKEVRLSREVDAGEFVLKVQGRIDGLLESGGETLLEEIKTVDRGWAGEPDPLHWAQAKIYAFIYAAEKALEKLTIQLSYLNLDTGKVVEFHLEFTVTELRAYFDESVELYAAWLRDRHHWCLLRDQSIAVLEFPFSRYRPGQREFAVAVYRALVRGGKLFAEAPTGIGKTMSVIFPALKALREGKIDGVFYLTARTVGRVVAEEAFARLRATGLRLQTLTLTAKERICLREGQRCDPADCPLARGYYERNKAAMREALGLEVLTRPVLETVSQKHQVCPFELSLDLSVWVDAVICDYNYVFDPKVYLRRHFDERPRDYAFLVDEAHNLVDRGRDMFSAELSHRDLRETRRAIKDTLPRCARALSKLASTLRKLGKQSADNEEELGSNPGGEMDLFSAAQSAKKETGPIAGPGTIPLSLGPSGSMPRGTTLVLRGLPEELAAPVDKVLEEAESWLARNEPADFRDQLLEFYFSLHSFRRTMDLYDERYVTLVELGQSLKLFCLDPAHLLGQALSRGKSAVFFSATLSPLEYYRDLLAGGSDATVLRLTSPLPPENLAVLVHSRLRTQLKERASSLAEVVRSISTMVEAKPGNYLVYFPSYAYLNSVREPFESAHPHCRVLVQRPGMDDAEREAFLGAFAGVPSGTLVGFAVMGGIFGEGIDLVGERLIGVAVVGVGLPQLCPERDEIRNYFQEKLGRGFDYAYTFPGMNRVLQATGRVIRSETDRGIVVLIDTRFAEQRYLALFPPWWQWRRVVSPEQIEQAVRAFWSDQGGG